MKESQDNKQAINPDKMVQVSYDETVQGEDSTLNAVITGGMELLEETLGNIQAEPEFPGKKKKKGQQQDEEQYRGPSR